MIDWGLKIIELKAMVDELEMWAGKSEGHLRAMLGRNADEMRAFIRQIETELTPSATSVLDVPPAWVTDVDTPSGSGEPSYYDETGPGDDFNPQM